MVSNKNQHYVPRCHLKPFTLNENGLAINLFNIKKEKVFAKAPVKNQCSGNYFYGKSALLEDAIRSIEDRYAPILREIRFKQQPPTSEQRGLLARFWLLQHLRTEATANHLIDLADVVKGLTGDEEEYTVKHAVQDAMQALAKTLNFIDDLKMCFVRNRTSLEFITSDNPAILTNRWYFEDRRVQGKSFGIRDSGTLIILPLTPKIILLGYDGDVYSVPHSGGWVNLRSEADVKALNQHQFLNCFSNVYATPECFDARLDAQHNVSKLFRPSVRTKITYAVRDEESGESVRYKIVATDEIRKLEKDILMHSEFIRACPGCWPAFIKWRSPGAVFTNGKGHKYLRRIYATDVTTSTRPFWRESAK